MKSQHLSCQSALSLVQSKRTIANPNAGFREQLKIWEECGYEVFERVEEGGEWQKQPTKAYKEWLGRRDRLFRERMRRLTEKKRRGAELCARRTAFPVPI